MDNFKSSVIVFLILSLTSCNSSKTTVGTTKTYAEISVKEGGSWNGNKYDGGIFKNQNQLRVPDSHTDHSYFIRYEGPGWESNKIGYRLYLDWRNAIDIFGKLTNDMVLPKVGQDGFDSYHNMSGWGADILKVGKGLGIGSIGRMVNNQMHHFKTVDSTWASTENHKKNSVVNVNYFGWTTAEQKTNLQSKLTIFPNERYTQHTITTSTALDGICTGIVNLYNLPLVQQANKNKKWGYIATYGKQTLFDDHLGMAIFYELRTVEKIYQGEHDHLIEFKATTAPITFYFLGAWEKEIDGITTETEFYDYLENTLAKLNATNKLK